MDARGFSLIELLVALAVAAIALGGIYSTYRGQAKVHVTQQQVVEMQQNLRAAMFVMEREIRMAGYDPDNTDNFGIIDVRAENGFSALTFTAANLQNPGNQDTISYSVYDSPTGSPDGDWDLARNSNGGGRQVLGENIEAFGLAYAFDNDNDGQLDTSANNNIIWAVDSDNDNQLDASLDTNDDGAIDLTDAAGGAGLATLVNINRIRAVRVWLLARTGSMVRDEVDTRTYVVAEQHITPSGASRNFKHRLLTSTIMCRNMGT